MWSVWANQGARPLTHSGRESDPRGYLTDFTAKRIASPGVRSAGVHLGLPRPHRSVRPIGLSNLWGRSVRPIGLSNLWGRVRERPCSPQSHVICLRVRSRVGGRSASHAHRASRTSTGRSNAFSREISQASPRIVLPRPVCVRGRSASHTASDSHGLTDRPHRSNSLTDLTLWQIWQIRLILAKLSDVP